jgi:hypothetical protein
VLHQQLLHRHPAAPRALWPGSVAGSSRPGRTTSGSCSAAATAGCRVATSPAPTSGRSRRWYRCSTASRSTAPPRTHRRASSSRPSGDAPASSRLHECAAAPAARWGTPSCRIPSAQHQQRRPPRRWGRKDCLTSPTAPTETEADFPMGIVGHQATVNFFQQRFGFTSKQTLALMGGGPAPPSPCMSAPGSSCQGRAGRRAQPCHTGRGCRCRCALAGQRQEAQLWFRWRLEPQARGAVQPLLQPPHGLHLDADGHQPGEPAAHPAVQRDPNALAPATAAAATAWLSTPPLRPAS